MDPGKLSEADAYKALLVIVTAAVAAGLIFDLGPLFGLALALGLACALSSRLTMLVAKGWFQLAQGLGWMNSRILLSLIFVLLVTPLALLYRMRRADPLNRKRKARASLFEIRDHTYVPGDLDKPW